MFINIILLARPLLFFFLFVNYPGETIYMQAGSVFHSTTILSVMSIALFLLFVLKKQNHFSKHNFTLGSRLNVNWYFFSLWSEISLVAISASLFCERTNQKETEYSDNEVDVNLRTRLSLKVFLLEWLEKVVIITLI